MRQRTEQLAELVPAAAVNPCVARVGQGPEETRCGSCANLAAIRIPTHVAEVTQESIEFDTQTVYYCLLSGQAKKVTWPSCSNFREAPLPYPVEDSVFTGAGKSA